MLTPEQIREQLGTLASFRKQTASDTVLDALIGLLDEVLPELVAALSEPARPWLQFRDYHMAHCNYCHAEIKADDREAFDQKARAHRRACLVAPEAAFPATLQRFCPDCTSEQPCARARTLVEGS